MDSRSEPEHGTLADRVRRAFQDGDSYPAEVDRYLEQLQTTWKDLAARISRTAFLTVALMGIFYLLVASRSSKSGFTLLGVQTEDTSLIQKFLPTVIAFLFYDLVSLSIRWSDTESTYHAVLLRYKRPIYDTGLHRLLEPQTASLYRLGLQGPPETSGERVENGVQIVLNIVFIFGPIVFQVLAFYSLFHFYHVHDLLVWGNLIITLLLMLSSWAITLLAQKSYVIG